MNLLDHIIQDNPKPNFVTMISRKSSAGFCFKISRKDNICFVHVLTGGISEKNFSYLGRFFIGGTSFLVGPMVKDTIEQKAFSYLFKNVSSPCLEDNYIINRKFTKVVY